MSKFLAALFIAATLITSAFAQGSLSLLGVGAAGGPSVPPTITFESITPTNIGSGSGTKTASMNIGATCPNRVIAVQLYQNSTLAITFTSATINGVSGTLGENTSGQLWVYASVPTGTTGVTVTISVNTTNPVRLVVFRLCDLTSATPIATQSSTASPGTISALTGTTGGVALFHGSANATAITWGGDATAFVGSGAITSVRYGEGAGASATTTSINATATYTGGTGAASVLFASSWF